MPASSLTYEALYGILFCMATVGERYQVVIERDVRRELGIQPGDRAVEVIDNGRLVITFLPAKHRRSLLGRLAGQRTITDTADARDRMADRLAREDRERGR